MTEPEVVMTALDVILFIALLGGLFFVGVRYLGYEERWPFISNYLEGKQEKVKKAAETKQYKAALKDALVHEEGRITIYFFEDGLVFDRYQKKGALVVGYIDGKAVRTSHGNGTLQKTYGEKAVKVAITDVLQDTRIRLSHIVSQENAARAAKEGMMVMDILDELRAKEVAD